MPRPGDCLVADFVIPAARLAPEPLTASDLRRGIVVVSTLPNIQKHACMAQIVDLEEQVHALWPDLRIAHVSADSEEHWQEVDQFHPDLRAAGYSLCCADQMSREAFVQAFGVGVEHYHRIAHGVFALQEGVFLAAEIPDDQMRPVEVRDFLKVLMDRIEASPGGTPQRDGRQ
jgi:hypothetical protein